MYPLIAVGLSSVGLLLLWLRHRPPARSPRSSVEEFHQTMNVLAPRDGSDRGTSGDDGDGGGDAAGGRRRV